MITGFPHGLLFHHFHNEMHIKGQGAISSDEFAGIIRWAGRERILDAAEWLSRALSGKLEQDDLCITFDDGLKCQFDVALPVLERFGIKAFWFIYSSPFEGEADHLELYRHFRTACFKTINDFYEEFFQQVESVGFGARIATTTEAADLDLYLPHAPFYTREDRRFRFVRDQVLGGEDYGNLMAALMERYGFDVQGARKSLWLGKPDIRELHGKGHLIGLHSHSHPTDLASLPRERQSLEYETNKSLLENVTESEIQVMSHPCNSYDSHTLSLLGDLDIQLGFRADMAGPAKSPLEHSRINHALIMREMT